MANEDCFAYYERSYGASICTALDALYCKNGKECKFYKPLKEVCGNCEYPLCKDCLTVVPEKRMF